MGVGVVNTVKIIVLFILGFLIWPNLSLAQSCAPNIVVDRFTCNKVIDNPGPPESFHCDYKRIAGMVGK